MHVRTHTHTHFSKSIIIMLRLTLGSHSDSGRLIGLWQRISPLSLPVELWTAALWWPQTGSSAPQAQKGLPATQELIGATVFHGKLQQTCWLPYTLRKISSAAFQRTGQPLALLELNDVYRISTILQNN